MGKTYRPPSTGRYEGYFDEPTKRADPQATLGNQEVQARMRECTEARQPGGGVACDDIAWAAALAPDADPWNEIDVVPEDGSLYSALNGVAYPDSIHPRSATELVDETLATAGSEPIDRLTLMGHGAPGNQGITLPACRPNDAQAASLRTDDLCTPSNPDLAHCDPGMTTDFERLRGHFATDGVIDLGGCNVGQGDDGERLVAEVAEATGVQARASSVMQRDYLLGSSPQGSEVICDPDPSGGKATCHVDEAPPGVDSMLNWPEDLGLFPEPPPECVGPRAGP